jgi:hypothetical protein
MDKLKDSEMDAFRANLASLSGQIETQILGQQEHLRDIVPAHELEASLNRMLMAPDSGAVRFEYLQLVKKAARIRALGLLTVLPI